MSLILVCIPAHKPRLDDLIECITTMADPRLAFVVVTNEPYPIDPGVASMFGPTRVKIVNTGLEEINLSKWWNIGLAEARRRGIPNFMVTESDVRMTPSNVQKMYEVLWAGGYGMVGPNLYGAMGHTDISAETRQDGWHGRHPGHRICQTWMVKTDEALEADERFAWWHADEQHEMRHRSIGRGTAIVGASVYERPLQQDTDPTTIPMLDHANALSRRFFRQQWGFGVLV